ncbi:AAA family ATPase [Actinomycetospora sp. OC33-EN08]|uniref:AAA family ATPase n=1 Tax=Actinomycetospora aurantiaca TaxID=3129233 RepID=A0ABU8MQ90_9PSEU
MAPAGDLLGRADVLDRVERLVAGGGRAVVLVGEPGIGKTAVLERAARLAAAGGRPVLRVTGSEAEAALPYAALHHLLSPVLDDVGALPGPQRAALLAALGMAGEVAGDAARTAFLVSVASLALLDSPRAGAPVVVVDDAQWLDPDSLAVVHFLARRAPESGFDVVAAVRSDARRPTFDDVDELELGALPDASAEALLDRLHPRLDGTLRARALELAEGNPLALVELPRALDSGTRDVPAAPGRAVIPLTRRLERAFARQVEDLPPIPAALVLVIAANTGGSVTEALRAGADVLGRDAGLDDLHPAVASGIVDLDGDRVRFRHPLVRSAVLAQAGPPAHRAAHTALAQVVADDPERRAWHRSEVVVADEQVAAELEAVAEAAVARGAPQVALVLLERAVDRGEDPEAASRRAARGAELAIEVGDRATGDRLLARVSTGDVAWTDALHLLLHQDDWAPDSWSESHVAAFVASVRDAADRGRAELALRVLHRLSYSSSPHVRGPVLEASRAIFRNRPDEPMGLQTFAREPEHAGVVRQEVLRALARDDLEPESRRVLVTAATRAYDFALGAAELPAIEDALLARGHRAAAAQAAVSLAWSHLMLGRFGEAEETAVRAEALCRETHQDFWTLGPVTVLAWLDGLRPDPGDPDPRVHRALAELPAGSLTQFHRSMFALARGASELPAGRFGAAADILRELFTSGTHLAWWGFADYAEACLRSDRLGELAPVLAQLDELVTTTSSPFLADQLAFARALLADGAEADAAVERALSAAPLANPFLRARLALAHGIRLRRARRVRDARRLLGLARELFTALGPTRWASVVDRELDAAGRPRTGPLDALTAQERQVAVLAGRGLSNRQIADHLLISPRTVSTHLHRVFRKLGVSHRGELGTDQAGA